jgi:hypothetical protein
VAQHGDSLSICRSALAVATLRTLFLVSALFVY